MISKETLQIMEIVGEGIGVGNISRCLNGYKKTIGGFKWKYL